MKSLNDREIKQFFRQFSQSYDLIPYRVQNERPDTDLPDCHQCGHPALNRLCTAFINAYDKVAWGEGYSEQELGKTEKIGGWVPLATSDGPIAVNGALLALSVLNAHAHYPTHRHGPREMYVTVSGGFWFERIGKERVWVRPGEVVFTEPNELHALHNGNAATLMIACWVGGSYEKSEIVA
ncbi:dimethylsulfonioproprionate lyase family protein [Roseovarius sp. E0-M6]|uniref:dimethylsulfonioproprionate lyase family protein n=1 Tax=Roseovarius sp. E0-M6 TaxID=3127118 RepID=UPI00300FFFB1